MKSTLAILMVISIAFFPSRVFAEGLIQQQKINPDKVVFYNVKRATEKLLLMVSYSKKEKINYQAKLLNKRLSELYHIASTKNKAHIEKTSQRYETTAGILTEYVLEKGNDEDKKQVKEILNTHLVELEKFPNYFEYDTAEWRFMMNDINSAENYSSKL